MRYSDQDDLTFFVWRLTQSADPALVEFELWQDGAHRPLDLATAPYPSEPFACDRLYLCFQYQLPGRWTAPTDTVALRAVHQRFGTIPGAEPRSSEVPQTYAFDPVPASNNQVANPQLVDLLVEDGFPIRRSFEWVLTGADEIDSQIVCEPPPANGWSPLSATVPLPQGWTDDPPCLAVRPRRSDRNATALVAPLSPGPELYLGNLDHIIETIRHPTQVAFLVDLQVSNSGRCEQLVNAVRHTILDEFAEERKPVHELGVYYPRDATGAPTSGCDQSESLTYPLSTIEADALDAMADQSVRPALALIVLNNLQLPVNVEKNAQLLELTARADTDSGPGLIPWLIGFGTSYPTITWANTTPWMPVESRDFEPSLRSAVRYLFPLSSTPALEDYALELPRPSGSQTPRYMRICQSSPAPVLYTGEGLTPQSAQSDPHPWPSSGLPALHYMLPTQSFIPFGEFSAPRLALTYEACDRFCDNPFQARNGQTYPSWLGARNQCQWVTP
ncbi:hypothetical protein DL240_00380 [Lujinxingia litoralis]|uniref:Uncharacterized protein n=1 Tax=Lujinxingia litoralis TaxID=2211119 RepID=A0A328CAZ1_9DELT|nr:hypothetical protein DL240_00380 [Lujinxingia litoralis]